MDRKVQYRLLAYNWLYFLIITAFIAVALFLPLSLRLHDSGLSWVQQGNLSRTFLFLHGNLWPVILVVFLLLSVHSLLISNKIVGPLLRFQAALRRFLQGDRWDTPVLRRDDILFDDLNGLGEMFETIQRRLDRIRTEHDEMDRLIQDLNPGLYKDRVPGEVRAGFLRISQQYARLKREIEGIGSSEIEHGNESHPN